MAGTTKDLVISVDELDNLFEDMVTTEMPENVPEEYANAYKSGQEDMARMFHSRVMRIGDVVME